MRSLDRYWWVRLVAALAYIVAIPLFLFWFFTFIRPYDLRYPAITLSDAILAAFVICALLALALQTVLATRLNRQRSARRAEVLSGGLNALPLARIATEAVPANTPVLVEAAYVHLARGIADIVIICAFWAGAFVFCADLVLAVILSPLGIKVPIPSSPPARPTANPIQYPVLVAIVWFGAAGIVTLYCFFAELSTLRFTAKHIQVSEDGITRLSLVGGRRFLAWRDAQLLEVSGRRRPWQQGKPRIEIQRYSLYGGSTVVRWEERRSPPGTRVMPVFEQVCPSVRLHTGLLPRTLSSESLAPDAVLRIATLDRIVARLPRWLIYATGGITFLSLASVDQAFSVFVLLYVCIGSSAWLISRAGKRHQTHTVSTDVQLTTPAYAPLLNQGAVYEMTVGSHQAFVYNQVMFVILGLLAIGFPLLILGALFAEYVLHVPGLHLYPLPLFVFPVLVGIMTLGVVTIVVAVRARDTIILADATGLRMRWAVGNILLPWGDIDRIERRRVYGFQGYTVYGRNGRTRIAWPSRYFVPSHRAQERGAILTTPDSMAALIAEQIGQGIQMRE